MPTLKRRPRQVFRKLPLRQMATVTVFIIIIYISDDSDEPVGWRLSRNRVFSTKLRSWLIIPDRDGASVTLGGVLVRCAAIVFIEVICN